MNEKNQTLVCDFTSGAVDHRRKFGGGLGQPLPRAVGMKNNKPIDVVDATAGLGRDSFLLASLGANVTMIERSPEIYELLKNAMEHARQHSDDLANIISRMKLVFGDAKEVLADIKPSIITIDPMHPKRKKTALVKKEFRLIREIVGEDPDAGNLIKLAIERATNRVVLKWPQKAEALQDMPKPSYSINGKTIRYDVFIK